MSRQHNFIMKDRRNSLLASNIKAERNRKNLTQSELAELIDMSDSTVSLIERGLQTPSIFVVHDIANALNIDIKELLKNIP
ncbi:MAG: helix-turn-helix domain-containing protein [Candidatus Gastranaerophilaceae bacterium]